MRWLIRLLRLNHRRVRVEEAERKTEAAVQEAQRALKSKDQLLVERYLEMGQALRIGRR